MEKIICAVFCKNNKIFCCKSESETDAWTLPYSDSYYDVTCEKVMESLKKVIRTDFKQSVDLSYITSTCYNEIENAVVKFCDSDNDEIELENGQEGKWILVKDFNSVKWETKIKSVIDALNIALQEQEYTITIDKDSQKFDGYQEKYQNVKDEVNIVWNKQCSSIEAHMTFLEIINKQSEKYHSRQLEKFFTIRLYNSNGTQIKQES